MTHPVYNSRNPDLLGSLSLNEGGPPRGSLLTGLYI